MRRTLPFFTLLTAATTTSAKPSTHNETVYKYTYSPNTTYQGWSGFFDNFDFVDDADPPGPGFAAYVNQSVALQNGMISNGTNGAIRIGVDSTTVIGSKSKTGRKAVRLNSKVVYSHGLFIADFTHMPGGICGTWPAYWMSGTQWPLGGELDILEGVNNNPTNKITGYTNATSSSCTSANTLVTGNATSTDCTDLDDTGCSTSLSTTHSSYGTSFNSNNGGVYAVEWLPTTGIKVWFFPRGADSMPADVDAESPDPSSWGAPAAAIPAATCDMATHFYAMQLVLNTNFCGSWANRTWAASGCAKKAPTCEEFVRKFPDEFEDAYWEVNYIRSFSGMNVSSTVVVNDTTSAAASVRPPLLLRWVAKMLV